VACQFIAVVINMFRLPTILDVIDNPEKTQKTTAIGTLF
jgi:hypothetical protein